MADAPGLPGQISGIAGMVGPAISAYMNSNDIQQGMHAFNNAVGQGTGVLQAGQQGANQAYSPYTQAGAGAIGNEANAINNRVQATNPTATNTNPNDVSQYLNPSAAYSQDQAMKQAQAAGIAGGAVGGGLLKAISNNANQMAQTNWNNAYNQMLQTNQQNFGQGQQLYQNNNDYQQQQIQNLGGLAGLGLQANNANQNLQLGYNNGINQNWNNIASNDQTAYNALGQNALQGVTNTTKGIQGGLTSLFGG